MDPVPDPAGMVPAPVVPGTLGRPVAPELLAGMRLAAYRRLQSERDTHAARCTGRALLPNTCAVLWLLDDRLRLLWAEILSLGLGLVDLYEPDPCAPECPDCAPPAVTDEERRRPVAYTSVTAEDWVMVEPR